MSKKLEDFYHENFHVEEGFKELRAVTWCNTENILQEVGNERDFSQGEKVKVLTNEGQGEGGKGGRLFNLSLML